MFLIPCHTRAGDYEIHSNYIKINNTAISPQVVAMMVKDQFGL
jgi:hypothetical protein